MIQSFACSTGISNGSEDALNAINTLASDNKTDIESITDGTNIDSFGDVETALADYTTTDDLSILLNAKANTADVDEEINNKFGGATMLTSRIASNGYAKFQLPSGCRAVVFSSGAGSSAMAGYFISYTTSSGIVVGKIDQSATYGVTISSSEGEMIITNTTNAVIYVLLISMIGTITETTETRP